MSTTREESTELGIEVTESAAEEAQTLLDAEGFEGPDAGLRVLAREKGCDCGDVAYGLEFTDETAETDQIDEQHGLRIVVGEQSREHVADLRLDYVDDFRGEGFMLESTAPNEGGCGCGGHGHGHGHGHNH
jgi:iron-sulfur cluster assembly protein